MKFPVSCSNSEGTQSRQHRIIVKVWQTVKWPEDWTQSTFVPLIKKGDPTVCANYRTISLVSHASKVLLKVILARIQGKVEYEVASDPVGEHIITCSVVYV